MLTFMHRIDLDMIRFQNSLEGMSLMPRLATRFAAMSFPSALRGWLVEAITRRWFAAVLTVLGHPVFQRLKTLVDLRKGLVKKQEHRFLALVVGLPNLFVRWQRQLFHRSIVHDFYDFDNPTFAMPEQLLSLTMKTIWTLRFK